MFDREMLYEHTGGGNPAPAASDLFHLWGHAVDMELESTILNFKRHAQTSPDQGTCQAGDNTSGSVENTGAYSGAVKAI